MQTIIETVEIPESIAKRLSTLLIKQSIRNRLLNEAVGDKSKFEQLEDLLIPIEEEISSIKNEITEKFIPEEFRSERFIWNYNGFEIDGNNISISKQW